MSRVDCSYSDDSTNAFHLCHFERSEKSKVGNGFAGSDFRFFTSLRCVQNDRISRRCVQNDRVSRFLHLFCHLPTPVSPQRGKAKACPELAEGMAMKLPYQAQSKHPFPFSGLRGVGIRYFICDAVALQYISIFTVIPNEVRNLASLTASGLGL